MLSFAIHFTILTHSGPGDAQMSSLFQAGLIGNNFAENPLGLLNLHFLFGLKKFFVMLLI